MKLDDLEIPDLRQRRGEKWANYPADVLPAWVADMDFPVCPPVRRTLEQCLAHGDVGYPTDAALDILREVFAGRARTKFGWEVDVERVEPLTDVVQGLYNGLLAYSQPGDGAIVQTPVYPPFLHAVPECRRRLVLNPLQRCDARYEIDFDHLRAGIDQRTRMLLFCNPQNPTGRAFSRIELERVAQLVIDHDLLVCSDEIHADLVYPGREHIPLATVSPEIAARTVTLTSASKAFNIAGLRCAVAVFGSQDLHARFNSYPSHLRGGLGILGLEATRVAWTEGQPWLDEVVAYLDRNRRFVEEFVTRELPGISCTAPEATYLAWLDCRGLEDSIDPYHFFLDRARVALTDGSAFGECGRGFLRLNFATSRTILNEILERMRAALAN